MKFYLF